MARWKPPSVKDLSNGGLSELVLASLVAHPQHATAELVTTGPMLQGIAPLDDVQATLLSLDEQGLALAADGHWRPTPRGFLAGTGVPQD
jgi:hypothetical protein